MLKVKNQNTDRVNSTLVVDDPDLQVPLNPAKNHAFEMHVIYSQDNAGGAPGLKFQIGGPAFAASLFGFGGNLVPFTVGSGVLQLFAPTSTTRTGILHIKGNLRAGPSSVAFKWAQNTAGPYFTRVETGSWLAVIPED